MTNFNTYYNNTELLDQELTIEQLEGVAGGLADPSGEQAVQVVEAVQGTIQAVREAIASITASTKRYLGSMTIIMGSTFSPQGLSVFFRRLRFLLSSALGRAASASASKWSSRLFPEADMIMSTKALHPSCAT